MENLNLNSDNRPMRKTRSDKGKKRSSYNATLRQSRKDINDLQATITDIAKFEKLEQKPDNEAKSRAERKRIKRLQSIPEPRICPHCLKPKLKSKQWVIRNDFIGCKSCFWELKLIPEKRLSIKKDESNGVSSSDSGQTLE